MASDPKKAWNASKPLMGTSKQMDDIFLKENGVLIGDPKIIVTKLADYFESSIKEVVASFVAVPVDPVRHQIMKILPQDIKFYFNQVNKYEIYKILKQCTK